MPCGLSIVKCIMNTVIGLPNHHAELDDQNSMAIML